MARPIPWARSARRSPAALLPGALNGTWKWIESELTLITIPTVGHFVQQDAAERVTRAMIHWLDF
ncbi:MAG: hypothetical protein HY717_02605 [Planctomycetes bacterium]|nr:hypothetical protein [Planctomycetota bacterium]